MTHNSPSGDRLERLVQMAGELEAFERELGLGAGASARIRLGAGRRGLSRRLYAGVGLALAACIAVAVVAPRLSNHGAMPAKPGAPSLAHEVANAPPTSGASEECRQMVIALYRDETDADLACDECWCVQTWAQEWPAGHDVTGVHRDELIRESLARSCVPNPEKMIVVGLSGRPADMPVTDDQAREIALCLVDAAGDGAQARGHAGRMDCVPHGLDLRVETWGRQHGG